MNRPTTLIAGILATASAVMGAAALTPSRLAHQPIAITAHFEDVVGLYVGNGVSVLGMPVGKVTDIVAKDGYVEVRLAIDQHVDIPADAQAVTVSSSILTDRQVELTPPYHDGPKLKNGDVLGLGRTRTPVEIDRTLAMMDQLGKAMHADADGHGPLGDLINLGADIAGGNGPKIKATLDTLASALRVGADNGANSKRNIQAIVTSLAELTQAAADNDSTIREFGSNLRKLTDILASEDLGSGNTGAKANQILAEATRLLEGHREGLRSTFADTRTITATLSDYRRELAETLDVGPMTIDNLYETIDPVAGSIRTHADIDKLMLNGQYMKELCNLMALKQLGCGTGTLRDYGPELGVLAQLDLMANGIGDNP